MKKIMFDDRRGLTGLTLQGVKTRTSRLATRLDSDIKQVVGIIKEGHLKGLMEYISGVDVHTVVRPPYMVGEKVAIAQSYKSLGYEPMFCPPGFEDGVGSVEGWGNKMYVKAELMKNFIEITDVRLERLQDITEKDILREGVFHAPFQSQNLTTGEVGDYAYLDITKKQVKTVIPPNM